MVLQLTQFYFYFKILDFFLVYLNFNINNQTPEPDMIRLLFILLTLTLCSA